jgi:catechol 2,3-dioxygenase-like lactoylglutathione lyase family enzyme
MEDRWEFSHVGLVVRDKDKVMEYYQSLGIGASVGPQPPGPALPAAEKRPPVTILIYGEPVDIDLSRPAEENARWEGNLQIGSLQLEVLLTPPTFFQWRYSEKGSEGISHMCFNVPEIKEKTAQLVEKGCQVVFSVEREGWIGENYLDTSKYGGVWLSMRPPKDDWFKEWEARRMAQSINNWKFRGVGLAVRDLDKAVAYYKSLGIGAFQPEVRFDSSSFDDFKVNGEPTNTTVKARKRMTQIGSLVYEFVQPLEGETIYTEALNSRGEGINDIIFTVEDLGKEVTELVGKGASVILSGKHRNDSAFAYIDTRRGGGNIMVRLIQAE